MHVRPVALALGVALAAVAAGAARADAIDGDWCKDGAQFSIRGPQIVTPAGTATEGAYDRHAFAYVVPENEAAAGTEIFMTLLNEQNLRLMIGSWTEAGEVWTRCEFVS
ncbi:MAG: hypothetical protein R3F55_14980 [Alphaproteobacteria bacterium]